MQIPSLTHALVAALLMAACTSQPDTQPIQARRFATNDPIVRGCMLKKQWLVRIWRGHHPAHSEDVTTVPFAPNYSGSFNVTSHSGPWDYLQRVPLVFYGPGVVPANGEPLAGSAGVTDVYATVAGATGVAVEPREGRVLSSALIPDAPPPRLVVVVVWDGVGRNVLERWPDAWPNLARLEREGTSFVDATVGSSPSITPPTHSSLGTGSFPRSHGVTAIDYRTASGEVRQSFAGQDPGDLELSTFADEIDLALGNRSLVGMVAWRSWHLGMLGHGTQTPGGDADHLALIGDDGTIYGNPAFYDTPGYLKSKTTLPRRSEELDRADGVDDGNWRGHPILEMHDNPAWARFETDVLLRLLRRERYGEDDVTDLMFTNYKITDIVGHRYSMDSPEMEAVLRAQDTELGRLVAYFEREIGRFVVVVTADHGNTPSPERSGAWPIQQGQVEDDVNARFGTEEVPDIVVTTSAAGPFLDRNAMVRLGIGAADVAAFLNGYTIADNWGEAQLPDGYEDRGDEPVFAAAFAKRQLDDVLECAFGTSTPPADLDAGATGVPGTRLSHRRRGGIA